MNLLIDLGNSRLKWATEQDGQLLHRGFFNNAELDWQQLAKHWGSLPEPRQIALACVSTKHLLEQALAAIKELWPSVEIVRAQSEANAFGVRNAYQQPEKLGVDRWLALLAARHFYQAPICIVDCGTAITVDLMDAKGQHLGGLISPGLTLMKHALANGAQALEFNASSYRLGPADFTEAAIDSGTLYAAVGLIESVLSRHGANYRLILTGGDAERIAQVLAVTPIIEINLVLHGLALILQGQS